MFRRSGRRFADKNMRQTKEAEANSDSKGTEFAPRHQAAMSQGDAANSAGLAPADGREVETGRRRFSA
jgi:hypothetical protein